MVHRLIILDFLKIRLGFENLGAQNVKNIQKAICGVLSTDFCFSISS